MWEVEGEDGIVVVELAAGGAGGGVGGDLDEEALVGTVDVKEVEDDDEKGPGVDADGAGMVGREVALVQPAIAEAVEAGLDCSHAEGCIEIVAVGEKCCHFLEDVAGAVTAAEADVVLAQAVAEEHHIYRALTAKDLGSFHPGQQAASGAVVELHVVTVAALGVGKYVSELRQATVDVEVVSVDVAAAAAGAAFVLVALIEQVALLRRCLTVWTRSLPRSISK